MRNPLERLFRQATAIANSVRGVLGSINIGGAFKQTLCSIAVGARYVHEAVVGVTEFVEPWVEMSDFLLPLVDMIKKRLSVKAVFNAAAKQITIPDSEVERYKKVISQLIKLDEEVLRDLITSTSSNAITEWIIGKNIPQNHAEIIAEIVWEEMVGIYSESPELGLIFTRAMFNQTIEELHGIRAEEDSIKKEIHDLQDIIQKILAQIEQKYDQIQLHEFHSIWSYITGFERDQNTELTEQPMFFRTPYPSLVDFMHGYIVERPPILNKLAENLEANTAQLLMAPSGAGKTTIAFSFGLTMAGNLWEVYYRNVSFLDANILTSLAQRLETFLKTKKSSRVLLIVDDVHLKLSIANELLRTVKTIASRYKNRIHILLLSRSRPQQEFVDLLGQIPMITIDENDTQVIMNEIVDRLIEKGYVDGNERAVRRLAKLQRDTLWELFFQIETIKQSEGKVDVCDALTTHLFHEHAQVVVRNDPVRDILKDMSQVKVTKILGTLARFSQLEIAVSESFLSNLEFLRDCTNVERVLHAYADSGDIIKHTHNLDAYYRFPHASIANLIIDCLKKKKTIYDTDWEVGLYEEFLSHHDCNMSDIIKIVEYDPYLANLLHDRILDRITSLKTDNATLARISEIMYRISKNRGFAKIVAESTGKVLIRVSDAQSEIVGAVAWHPDLPIVATGSIDTTIRLHDAKSGHHLKILQGHKGYINDIAWRPDGKRVASAGDDRSVIIWNHWQGTVEQRLEGHSRGVMSIAWSSNGLYIASASADRTVRIWNVKTGECLIELKDHKAAVTGVAWNHIRNLIASVSADGKILIWRIQDENKIKITGQIQGPVGIHAPPVWSKSGNRLVVGNVTGQIFIWNIESNNIETTQDKEGPDTKTIQLDKEPILRVWADDKNIVVAQRNKGILWIEEPPTTIAEPNIVTLNYSTEFGTAYSVQPVGLTFRFLPIKKEIKIRPTTYWVDHVEWSPDGKHFATVSDDGWFRIWDLQTYEVIFENKFVDNWLISCSWRKEGNRISISSSQGEVILCQFSEDLRTIISTHRRKIHEGIVRTVWWHPSEDVILTSGLDGKIIIYNPEKDLIEQEKTVKIPIIETSWSHKGDKIVHPDERGVVTIVTRRDIHEIVMQSEPIDAKLRSIAWSPDDTKIVAGTTEGDLIIWDAKTGKQLRKQRVHTGWIRHLVWSAHDNKILTASEDHTMQIIDAESLEVLYRLPINGKGASIAVDPVDGKRFIISDSLGEIILQEMDHKKQEEETTQWR
ncbi:MAG: WD40 repeat domain-containing protein [Candidatus Thorarchaeota archaeon]|nr:WD40 repeat domain-containing protein [Candidatus Thorarchaeota archaeon]